MPDWLVPVATRAEALAGFQPLAHLATPTRPSTRDYFRVPLAVNVTVPVPGHPPVTVALIQVDATEIVWDMKGLHAGIVILSI